MREQGADMWIVPVREYNEDPVFHSIVSPTTFAARRWVLRRQERFHLVH